MPGTVLRLWTKRAFGGPMDPHERVSLIAGRGVEGNVDQGTRRQVTLIDLERWQRAEHDLGASIDPAARRANVLLSGLPLAETRGRILRLGAARLRVLGETRPCEVMDAAHPGLMEALDADWGGGVYAEVLDGGPVAVGDAATWESGEESPPPRSENTD